MEAFVEVREPDQLRLSGDLRFATVVAIRERLEQLIATGSPTCVVDFSAVKSADSSALSLWLCCRREAQRQGVVLEAREVPAELMSVARLVGLEHIFPA
ncbi:STAS domain-containing protein [Marinobacterium aestuariivivens]|uniref:Lipid asymmetry maintenance protein MlaB n=1 Tax=Marinobacterium aestuariivivens TaxID=1698799 RepID=A0ABW1ZWC1_9GAMM